MSVKNRVSVGWQVVFMFIPYLWIFAFLRIQKLQLCLLLLLGAVGISVTVQMILPFPYGMGLAFVATVVLPIRFIVTWSREWNASIK